MCVCVCVCVHEREDSSTTSLASQISPAHAWSTQGCLWAPFVPEHWSAECRPSPGCSWSSAELLLVRVQLGPPLPPLGSSPPPRALLPRTQSSARDRVSAPDSGSLHLRREQKGEAGLFCLRVSEWDRAGRDLGGALSSFYSGETEAQEGGATCPKSHSGPKTRIQVSAVSTSLSCFF